MRTVNEARIGANALREYFTLQHAARRAEATPDALRASLRTARAVAAQKRAAAEVLWAEGCHEEALALARAAFATLAEACEGLSNVPRVVVEEGDDVERYERLLAAHECLERSLAPAALDAPALRRLGRWRVVVALGAAAAATGAWGFWISRPVTVRAEASASYDLTFPASSSVDGNVETEWLLPDRTTGTLDLTFSRPRRARALELVNCMNAPYNDRGTRAYRVEVFAGGRLVRAVDGTFPPQTATPTRVTLDLANTGKIERIRFSVLGYNALGGGLAEAIVR